MPQISVILPVYNAEKYINKAVQSILSQTFTDFELIVIDDGSTDNTFRLLRSFQDKRIRIITHAKNQGIVVSLSDGIAIAKGKFIARQDADDISLPQRFAKQITYLQNHPKVAVLGTWYLLHSTATAPRLIKSKTTVTREELIAHNSLGHGTVMIRKAVIEETGGYNAFYQHAEDYELWLRISARYAIACLPEVLYQAMLHETNISKLSHETQMLCTMLIKNKELGKVTSATLAKLRSTGIQSYYPLLSKQDKIWLHRRNASWCKRHQLYARALEHYHKLQSLQGWKLSVAIKKGYVGICHYMNQ